MSSNPYESSNAETQTEKLHTIPASITVQKIPLLWIAWSIGVPAGIILGDVATMTGEWIYSVDLVNYLISGILIGSFCSVPYLTVSSAIFGLRSRKLTATFGASIAVGFVFMALGNKSRLICDFFDMSAKSFYWWWFVSCVLIALATEGLAMRAYPAERHG